MPNGSQPEKRELRNFGLLLGLLFAGLFGGIPLLRHHSAPFWPWVVAASLILCALLLPRWLRYLHRGWTHLGNALGWVNTRVILSLLYVTGVVPLGLAMRLWGRDPMKRKSEPELDSYRVPSRQRPASHLERPF